MAGIETGWINRPQITLSQDLIETFFRYWRSIMDEDQNTTIALPFFHMKSEPFWELCYNKGMQPFNYSPSLGGLMKRVAYAELDEDWFTMLSDEEDRPIILNVLFDTYFSDKIKRHILDIHHINVGTYHYAQKLESLAAEPFEKYHASDEDEFYSHQKTQQRQQGFGLAIRENYNHRCAICRARAKAQNGASLVEGAHIIPWSESKNDDPRNGLALCKTHHWMFDNNLLAVKSDYRIKISSWLKDKGEHIEQTLSLDQEKILLPKEQRFTPSVEALETRYEAFKSVR